MHKKVVFLFNVSKTRYSYLSAFTIVELLVVIVVIGILAAITIVSYAGIQQKAVVASLTSDLANASQQIKIFQIDNSAFPASVIDCPTPAVGNACIKSSPDTTYQYTVNNSSTPQTFCITATKGTTSYKISNDGTPITGGCPGHGVGGIAPVTNYVANPNAAGSSVVYFGSMGSSPAPSTRTIVSDNSHNGTTSLKINITGIGQLGITSKTPTATSLRVNAGEKVSWSFWVYSTKAGSLSPYIEGTKVSDGTYNGGGGGSSVSVVANTWTRVTGIFTPVIDVYITQAGGYNLPVVAGDVAWADEFSISKTSQPINYADGDSSNWVWDGTTNASTSTGPSL